MIIAPLRVSLIAAVEHLIGIGGPYVWPRTPSDYWLYAELFSSTCPVAVEDDELIGVVIAFRSQDKPDDVYIQDVVTHPDHRRRGIAGSLLDSLRQQATTWGCRRLYLTSEPDNTPAQATWRSLGFTNVPGDRTVNGVSVISNYKGPGKDRAVYELTIK
jgi:GNAT superfamily N-acetyltransferase